MNQIIHIEDGEAVSLAGVSASPSAQASAAGSSVIQFPFQAVSAALVGLEDESSPDMFESIGELSVRLLATWELPRLVCWSQREGEA